MTTTREPLRCKRCGCYAVTWRQTRAGRWYLAIRIFDATPEDRSYLAGGAARRPHKCETHQRAHYLGEDGDNGIERRAAERYARLER